MDTSPTLNSTITTQSINLSVERNALLKVLSHCQGVVEKRNTVPILSNILLEAFNNSLKITATDLEIAFSETIPAFVTQEGVTTVSAQVFYDIVRKLKDGSAISLELKEGESALQLHAGRSQFSLACLSSADFPVMSVEAIACKFPLHAAELSRLIDKTRFAMSTEETRYYLNGLYFHITAEGLLKTVATDGHRLALAQIPSPEAAQQMPGIIISRKTIGEIRKLIDESADEIMISVAPTQVQFQVGQALLTSRLVEGNFPDYEKVIPTANDALLEVNVSQFADAVDRVSLMSSDKMKPIKFRVQDQLLTLSAESNDMGSAREELEVTYGGVSLNIGFNSRYILDVAQQVSGETLHLLLADETQAAIAKDPNDEAVLYVLMPMRV